eukprot:403353921
MDLATSLTKKRRNNSDVLNNSHLGFSETFSQHINTSNNNKNMINEKLNPVDSSGNSKQQQQNYKLTSLPFHQFHKQTYSAFQTPQNSSSFAGSTATTHRSAYNKNSTNSKMEKDQLDKLYNTLNKFYQSEKQTEFLKMQQKLEQDNIKEELAMLRRQKQNKDLKDTLINQIQHKSTQKHNNINQEKLQQQQQNHKFYTVDTNLVSVFPKITETPKAEKEKKQDLLESQDQIKYEMQFRNKNEDKQEESRAKQQQQARNEWEANLKAKELKSQVKGDAERLQYEIVHGKYVNAQIKNKNKQLLNITQKLENQNQEDDSTPLFNRMSQASIYLNDQVPPLIDGNRYLNHNKKNLTSCNFLLSNAGLKTTPRTQYQETFFQNNGQKIRSNLSSQLDKPQENDDIHLNGDYNRQQTVDKKGNAYDNNYQTVVHEQVIEEDQETINQDENYQNDAQSVIDNLQDTNNLTQPLNNDDENITVYFDDKSKIDGHDNQSMIEVKSRKHQRYNGKFDEIMSNHSKFKANRSRMQHQNQVQTQNDAQSQSSQPVKLSRFNLEKMNQTLTSTKSYHQRVMSETASTISSKQVQEKVMRFTNKLIPPSLAQEDLQLNTLQFDALKRFIKQLEQEAIDVKRVAKEARLQNKDYDKRVDEEEKHNLTIQKTFRKNILQQIKQNSIQNLTHKELELSKPHIEGNEGYPPRPEPTRDEAKFAKRQLQQINKINLEQQIKDKDLLNKTMGSFNRTQQLKELFETQKLQNQEAMQTKAKSQSRKQDLDEIWQKTLKIQELKSKLQKELGVSFNDDKIKSMIKYNYGGVLLSPKDKSKVMNFDQQNVDTLSLTSTSINLNNLKVNYMNKKPNMTTAGSLMSSQYIKTNVLEQENNPRYSSVQKQRNLMDKIHELPQNQNAHSLQRIQQKINDQRSQQQNQQIQLRRKSGSQIEDNQQNHKINKKSQQKTQRNKDEIYPWENRQSSKEQARVIINKTSAILL